MAKTFYKAEELTTGSLIYNIRDCKNRVEFQLNDEIPEGAVVVDTNDSAVTLILLHPTVLGGVQVQVAEDMEDGDTDAAWLKMSKH